jgi:PAS domain S-box-containing protein
VDAAIVTIDCDGIITDCNTATCKIFDYKQEQLLGKNVNILMPSSYRDQHDGYLAHHLNTGETRIIGTGRKVSGLRSNGQEFALHLSVGKFVDHDVTFFTGIIHDLSELEAAQYSANRLASIVEELDSEVFTFSADTLKITSANPAVLKNTGYSHNEFLQKSPVDLVSGLNRSILQQTLNPLLKSPDKRVHFKQQFVRRDGSLYQADVNLYLSKSFDPPEFVVIAQDVTDRNLIMNSLRRSQRMESIGNLTGGIAHDFNNLLTVLMGNLELLELDPNDTENAELVNDAQDAAKMGARLTQRLLAFARRSPLSPKRTNINSLVRDITEMLSRTLGTEVVLKTVLEDALYDVSIDVSELENALINMCINARDAMPSGGTLLLETYNTKLEEDSIVGKEISAGHYVRLEVTDTGTGIAPEVIESLFEPFVSTKPSSHGTGLGLSMVYGFVKQSGGEIDVYSEPDIGTRFVIYLPALESADAIDNISVDSNGQAQLTRKRILVAEDDDRVRRLTVRRLESIGHSIIEAPDGHTALKLFQQYKMDLDCVFTDVVMTQGMSGYDVALEVRRIDPNMPVLLTSGYAEDVINHEKLQESGLPLLRKPYGQQELIDALQALFEPV